MTQFECEGSIHCIPKILTAFSVINDMHCVEKCTKLAKFVADPMWIQRGPYFGLETKYPHIGAIFLDLARFCISARILASTLAAKMEKVES